MMTLAVIALLLLSGRYSRATPSLTGLGDAPQRCQISASKPCTVTICQNSTYLDIEKKDKTGKFKRVAYCSNEGMNGETPEFSDDFRKCLCSGVNCSLALGEAAAGTYRFDNWNGCSSTIDVPDASSNSTRQPVPNTTAGPDHPDINGTGQPEQNATIASDRSVINGISNRTDQSVPNLTSAPDRAVLDNASNSTQQPAAGVGQQVGLIVAFIIIAILIVGSIIYVVCKFLLKKSDASCFCWGRETPGGAPINIAFEERPLRVD